MPVPPERPWRYAQDVLWILDRIGLAPGASVVDLGCGPRGGLEQAAQRVGPRGRVVGVERRAPAVRQARQLIQDRGLANVEIRHGDARDTGLPRGAFDLATGRMVLLTVARPQEIVAEAFALARPGGIVAFQDADFVSHVCDPPLPAWDRLTGILDDYAERSGFDLHIARRLPQLLRAAGLVDVEAHPRVYAYPPGHSLRSNLLDFVEKFTDRLVAAGVVGAVELADLKRSLADHLADPATLVISPMFLQAWGRKPGGAPTGT